jgi:hypothetical protein
MKRFTQTGFIRETMISGALRTEICKSNNPAESGGFNTQQLCCENCFQSLLWGFIPVIRGILLAILVSIPAFTYAQEPITKESPALDFTFLKKTDGSKLLTTSLTIFRNRITYPVTGSNISFFLGTDTATAVIKTNYDGKAYLIVQPGVILKVNKEGITQCRVSFAGNDTIEAAESSLDIKDAVLKMSLDIIDSVKTVNVWAYTIGNKLDTLPLAGEAVNVYAKRMFSNLKIGEGSFDEQGRFSVEFPADLPGEADGTVDIMARIEENEKFANIETVQSYAWGVPSMHGPTGSHRALWTAIAPMWMIVSLTIMLLGVWGHYIYVIIQLVLIKRESKKNKF